MSVDQLHQSSVLLTRRLLWNRALGGQPRPQPVVVLLGPVGSGKSAALKSISGACGAEVVHALVDFHHDELAAAQVLSARRIRQGSCPSATGRFRCRTRGCRAGSGPVSLDRAWLWMESRLWITRGSRGLASSREAELGAGCAAWRSWTHRCGARLPCPLGW